MMELLVERARDYRELMDLLPDEGYEVEADAGHNLYEMSDGTETTFRVKVDVGHHDTPFFDMVQAETDGKVEARTE